MRVDQAIEAAASIILAAAAGFVLTMNVVANAVHDARTAVILLLLIGLNVIRCPWLWISREIYLYLAFFGFTLLSFLWTPDVDIATNIVVSMFNFVLIMVLYTQTILYHKRRYALPGLLLGLLAGAALFTLTTHFPFSYPDGMSYNTVAGMYLFTLIVTLLVRLQGRWRFVLPIVALGCWAHIVATTSIKTNLGVAIAALVVCLLQFGSTLRLLLRNMIPLAILIGGAAYFIVSHPTLSDTLQNGMDRVSLGVGVLSGREDDSGATGVSFRENWKTQGLRGWAQSPVFGNGAEAFRTDVGITSHSTVIDLLYNSGLLGLGLFYSILASVAWRWWRHRNPEDGALRAVMLGVIVCYGFISVSGLMYYDAFLPAFLAISVALARQREAKPATAHGVLSARQPRGLRV